MRATVLVSACCLFSLACCKGGTSPGSDDKVVQDADDSGVLLDDTGHTGDSGDDTALVTDADGDGWVAEVDCDDGDPTVHPDAPESCNDVDDDCDQQVDEDLVLTWYEDVDGDGYGIESGAVDGCAAPGERWVVQAGDCDDADGAVFPGAEEQCNGADDDCDADIDEDVVVFWYPDGDGDGYGDMFTPTAACEQPDGLIADGSDCDDTLDLVNVDGVEACNGLDDDCDGLTDEDDAIDALTWFLDADGDGFGDRLITAAACEEPSGYVAADSDCNDSDWDVNPDAVEVCSDGIDNDCDGTPTGCSPYGDLDVTSADALWRGGVAGDRFGQGDPGIAAAGDVNGDGVGDVIVGAVRESTAASWAGAAYLFTGPLSGEISVGVADATMLGEGEKNYAGRAVAGLGDVDADGFDDVVVTAQGEATNGTNAGAAYVVLGPVSGTFSLGSADAFLPGVMAGDLVADAAQVGDTNGDGFDDLLIAALWSDLAAADAGAVYVVNGPMTGTMDLGGAAACLVGEAASDEAGSALWGAGDLDGDGNDDIVIGARGNDGGGANSGAAYVVLSPASGTSSLGDAYAVLLGESAGDEVGWGVSVSAAGDVNADGHADLLVGSRNASISATYAGAVYLLLGPIPAGTSNLGAADAVLMGEAERDYTGDSVHGPGDVDGDGFDDILVGSGYSDAGTSNGGAVYLVSGPVTGALSLSLATARLLAEGDEDRLRTHGAGDVDGDGLPDILVGAQNNDSGGTDAGAAYLFLGGAW